MPMNFPNMESLKQAAKVHKFREPEEGETEPQFRCALHQHVLPIDRVEAFEIAFKVGWDQWTAFQQRMSLGRPLCMSEFEIMSHVEALGIQL